MQEARESHAWVWDQLWIRLLAAVEDRQSPWRTPVLATLDGATLGGIALDGHWPAARTVILRDVLPQSRHLVAHVDRRSPKINQLQSNPHASWTFYDPAAAIQLRINSQISLHTEDELASSQWSKTPASSRKSYLSTEPPGAPLPGPISTLPAELRGRELTEQELMAGRPNFCVLLARVLEIDWYDLHPAGHLRLKFDCRAEQVDHQWIAT
ncbi:pyridoxamine 5'-phosphate oxidase family protein [Planctopirus hydrillae]|uniref:Pyridoxamine 5'-phosphate oxidase Alr4036 family FMN-binding domain-containing protein n=1 Tax=Planctopirus hydrillae TaxID=1841610 RepID=A0A1C3E6R3_9PLAN|nr:pyridoxamine 5'-phosphate oxidase family protein [Planctopirus hydrillae]ODA28947.1 hypothetical protein A6X21_10680 [Planctopirus hydrillae]